MTVLNRGDEGMRLDAGPGAIRVFCMDVDGTLTDGKVYVGDGGELFKAFDVKDGLGIRRILPERGIVPVVITGRESAMLARRCAELAVEEVHQGVSDKLPLLEDIAARLGASMANVAYIGDDVNDLDCMRAVKSAGGVVGCPADAVLDVLEIADFVSRRCGGAGAVRDFIDYLA